MTDPEDRLAEIRQRHAAATSGPWEWEGDYPAGTCPHGRDHWDDHGPNLINPDRQQVIGSWGHDAWGVEVGDADAEFIAHAPEDIDYLLRQVEQLKDRLRELEWSRWGECPVCGASSSDGEPHGPECWLWLAIRSA